MAITQNPFLNPISFNTAGSTPATPSSVSTLNGMQPTMGLKAKNPTQNIQKQTNILPTSQIRNTQPTTNVGAGNKTALNSQTKPTTFTPAQNTGLLAALQRQKSGTATPEDVKNINYATSKGYQPPTPATPEVKPTDISSTGVITKLTNDVNTPNSLVTGAGEGLLNTNKNNSATSGQAYTDYQKSIEELNNLKKSIATQSSNIESTPIPLEFQQGRQQVLDRQNAAYLDAAQQKVNQAETAINQQITGTQTQNTGYASAGNLGNTQQQTLQSGLTSVAGFTQPVQVSPSNQYVNPQTGIQVGNAGIGGSLDSAVNSIAEKVKNGTMGYDAAVSALSGYGQLGTNALQQALGPNFNIQQSNANAQAQGASTLQTGTVGGLLTKSADSANQALNKLENDFGNLSSLQTGGVPITNSIANFIASKLGQGALSSYETTLHDARAQLGGVLTATGAVSPTGAEDMAKTYLPDDMTPTMLKEKLGAARALIQQKVSSFTQSNPNSSSSNSKFNF